MKNAGLIIFVVLLVAVAGAGVYFYQQNRINSLEHTLDEMQDGDAMDSSTDRMDNDSTATKPDTQTSDDDEDDESAPTVDSEERDDLLEDTAQVSIGSHHEVAQGRSKLSEEAAVELEQNGQTITGTMMPINTSTGTTFYFTTAGADEEGRTVTRVYSYNEVSGNLSELYWERADQEMWLLGIDEEKLIVYRVQNKSALETCFMPWLDQNGVEYLDVSQPAEGTFAYSIPEEVILEATTWQLDCQQEVAS